MINFLLHVLNPQNMEQNQWISCSFFQEGYDEINLSRTCLWQIVLFGNNGTDITWSTEKIPFIVQLIN